MIASAATYQFDIPLVAVVGPTASGKSGLAVELAKRYGAEIVSVDSLQVYRALDIGTGKVTREERQGIPHHLIDVADIREDYDAGRFQREADEVIAQLDKAGRRVILAGGTGLYLRALLHGLFDVPSDDAIRAHLLSRVEDGELAQMYAELQQVDPVATIKITPRDRSRIVRALEVFLLTGKPFSSWAGEHQHQERRYPALLVGVDWPRPVLYARIHERIESMFRMGWMTEVEAMRLRGYSAAWKPMQCIGYRELHAVLDGTLDPIEAIAQIQQATRTYAKRQMTWFRKEAVRWYATPEAVLDDSEIAEALEVWWSQRGGGV